MILILKSKFYKRNYITPTKVYGNSFNKLYEKSIYPIGKKNTHTHRHDQGLTSPYHNCLIIIKKVKTLKSMSFDQHLRQGIRRYLVNAW